MELGLLFSKVEKKLNDSYINQTFKTEISNFKNIVISNKMLSECYYLYSNLTTKQGMSSDVAKEYLEESIKTIKNKKDHLFLIDLKNWVKDVVCENQYVKIDSLLKEDVLKITENIENKKQLVSTLTESKDVVKKQFVPFVENVVKYNLEKYIDGLEPEVLQQLDEVFSKKEDELKPDFDVLKENTLIKLKNHILTNNDEEIKQKLNETVQTVEKEPFNKINYLKLQNLYEGL
jgi:hypothetical protein